MEHDISHIKDIGDIMNIFFNSRIYTNQSFVNALFGKQQKTTRSQDAGCSGTRDTLTISASGKEKLVKNTKGRTHNTNVDKSIDLKSYIASAQKTNQKIIDNAGTQINAKTSEYMSTGTQYTDTLSISKTGQEIFKHLSSVSFMDYVNRFENEVTEVFAKEDTTQGVKSDTFEHHVNRMATAYNKMKNSIEEKYAAQDYEQEYYVTESGKIEELTKEKELDMLNQAYENHSNFMATSTEIWSELQDFTPSVVYHKGSEQTANEQNIGENQENTARSKENGVIQNSAYQAFLSAIQSDNQKLSQQYSGDWKDLRLNLNVSDGDRKMLNGIWDYYAMESE